MEINDNEIIFSRAVKAGKRIYYLDVKKNRKNEPFLAITESKKVVSNTADNPQFTFEKHKIFLYKEDIEKFMEGFLEVVEFINSSKLGRVKTELEDIGRNINIDLDKFE